MGKLTLTKHKARKLKQLVAVEDTPAEAVAEVKPKASPKVPKVKPWEKEGGR